MIPMTETPCASRQSPSVPREAAPSPAPQRALSCVLITLMLSLLLTACGPGTGGTGTGPDAGASAGPGDSLVAGGELLGTWRGGDVLAVFEPRRVRVQQGCRVLAYEGPWGPDPLRGLDLAVRADGAAASPAGGEVLTLQVVPIDADRIRMTVRDANGAVLIGPLEARRVATPTGLNQPVC